MSAATQDWRTLPAGRELDALVAERVRGWHRVPQPKDCDGNHGGEPVLIPSSIASIDDYCSSFTLPPRGCLHLGYFTPQVSTDFCEAWRLAAFIACHPADHPLRVAFTREVNPPELLKYPPSQAALVICRAALAAREASDA